jgi:hypothetical protein
MKSIKLLIAAILVGGGLVACQSDSRQQILATDQSQVSLRSIQTRMFDTSDQSLTVRTVIATLQDLGFAIDKVDNDIGVVSATKAGNYLLKMTISSRPRGPEQISVRASAQYNITAVSDPKLYQQFFEALSKAMFLEAHQVN